MAINETVTGPNSVAITGTAIGEKSLGLLGIGNGTGTGVKGEGDTGVWGHGKTWMGVYGFSESTTGGHGVMGEAVGTGVVGVGQTWLGVYGETHASPEAGAAGVWGEGKDGGDGVKGHASAPGKAGVAGFHLTNRGPGIFGKGSPAGFFEGNVVVTGSLTVQGVDLGTLLQRIAQLEQQGANTGQLVQRISSLEQRVASLESQLNTAISNLTARVTQAEVTISGLASLSHTHS